MDNAKIFSQLMFKSRSLAKVSERRLQPVAYAGGGGVSKRVPPLRPFSIQGSRQLTLNKLTGDNWC